MATKNIVPNADGEGQLGTSSKSWAQGHIDSITGTIATAAQGSITSLGTLTTLTVDNVIVNGTTIGHTSDTDLLTLTDGKLNVSGKIGIGVDPTTLLHLNGTGDAIRVESTNAGAGGAQMDLLHFSASPADNDVMGAINMGGYYSGTSSAYFGSIKTVATDISARSGELQFFTNNSGTFTKQLTISSVGNVGISTSGTPASLLNIGNPGGNTTRSIQIEGNNSHSGMASTIGYFSNALYISNNYYYNSAQVHPVSTYGQTAIICSSGTTTGSNVIDFSVSDHNESDDAPNVKFRIVDSGDVTVSTGNLIIGTSGKGIDFTSNSVSEGGGGGVASSTLDDYEEGNWIPVYSDDSGNAITNLVGQTGSYVKVGKLIYISGSLRTQSSSSTTGVSGNLNISGLPFTSDAVAGQVTFRTHETASAYNTPAQLPRASPVAGGGAVINIYKYSGSGGRTIRYLVSDLNMSGNSNFMFFSGTYEQA